MKLDPHFPEPVQLVLRDYLQLSEQRLIGLIDSSYIVGSIALGEFNEHFSDIDFVTVLNRRATPIDLGHLRRIHQSIERRCSRWKMSGSYIQATKLGKRGTDLGSYPDFHDGKLHTTAHNGVSAVTRRELKKHGIPIVGIGSRNLPFTMNWNALIAEMRENLNTYWRSWTRHPRRVAALYSNWGVQWAVLGVLRQYFTFKENTITSKVRAGEYALVSLPHRWRLLIQEAICSRQTKQNTAYRSRFGRMMETTGFLRYVIDLCNNGLIP